MFCNCRGLIQDLALLATLSDSGGFPEFSEPQSLQLSNVASYVLCLGQLAWG